MQLCVAIVHYHLHPGGVTRVIQHQVCALHNQGARTAVLVGEQPKEQFGPVGEVGVVKGLGYDATDTTLRSSKEASLHSAKRDIKAEQLLKQMQQLAGKILGKEPDIWHIHNHSLGKNATLPLVVYLLAAAGNRLLLQIHDFAEDGRPGNYTYLKKKLTNSNIPFDRMLYPSSSNVHYALINSRDLAFFQAAGAEPSRLHLLPNAVWPTPILESPPQKPRLFVYPSRAIRRKNLGEFLLLAALAEKQDRFAVTLSPDSPDERPVYERWVQFSQRLRLPVEFEVGYKASSLEEVMTPAYCAVSTSIAEGFGLCFLEPWVMGRPLIGRNLPEITADLAKAGIKLQGLYNRLDVPVAWLGQEKLTESISDSFHRYLQTYGTVARPEDTHRAIQSIIHNDQADFGRLHEPIQEELIRNIITSKEKKELLKNRLQDSLRPDYARIEHNRQVILSKYSLEAYGRKLSEVYKSVLESPQNLPACSKQRPAEISAERLLDQFIAPERFSMLRTD